MNTHSFQWVQWELWILSKHFFFKGYKEVLFPIKICSEVFGPTPPNLATEDGQIASITLQLEIPLLRENGSGTEPMGMAGALLCFGSLLELAHPFSIFLWKKYQENPWSSFKLSVQGAQPSSFGKDGDKRYHITKSTFLFLCWAKKSGATETLKRKIPAQAFYTSEHIAFRVTKK